MALFRNDTKINSNQDKAWGGTEQMCAFKGSIKPDKTLIMGDFDSILIDFSEVWTCLAETESSGNWTNLIMRASLIAIGRIQ